MKESKEAGAGFFAFFAFLRSFSSSLRLNHIPQFGTASAYEEAASGSMALFLGKMRYNTFIVNTVPRSLWHLPRRFLAGGIGVYQKTLSPDHGMLKVFFPHGCCVYAETCSEYGKRVILKRGAIIGSALALRRLLSCHPWKELPEEKILDLTGDHK